MKLPFESHYIFMRTSFECFNGFANIPPTKINGWTSRLFLESLEQSSIPAGSYDIGQQKMP